MKTINQKELDILIQNHNLYLNTLTDQEKRDKN